MVALYAEHHAKAAAWTVEDFRMMKAAPPDRLEVRGRFEWMRKGVLAVIGDGYYFETPNMVLFRGKRIFWFERDDQGRLLLNL